jgi:hypothetical protein
MDLELDPPQPDEVTRALTKLLEESEAASDPWWQAGIDEALEEA